jgi:Zn finger protein HypA/HybF involved in hydrogenase expression
MSDKRTATLEDVVEKSRSVHGDKYTYLRLVKDDKNTVKIVCSCPFHGEFSLRAARHYTEGKGCPKCVTVTSLEEFKKVSSEKHNYYYDYSESVFTTLKDKVKIKCPEHGVFEQSASDHMNKYGCPKCGITKRAEKNRKNTSDFLEKAKEVHGDRYDYTKTIYTKANAPVVITCKEHGDFTQKASCHVNQKQGCPVCGGVYGKTTETFIKDAIKIHGEKYDYSETGYTGALQKLTIICPTHGRFSQIASNHLQGSGCPSCAVTGFDNNKPGILYYLRVTTTNGVLYKIGITNLTVQQRFSSEELSKIKVLRVTEYIIGLDAYKEEQKILEQYSQYLYKGGKILKSGNTELFTQDVLGEDYEPLLTIR